MSLKSIEFLSPDTFRIPVTLLNSGEKHLRVGFEFALAFTFQALLESVDESLRTHLWTLTPARASSHKKSYLGCAFFRESCSLLPAVLISLPLCPRADAIFTSKEHVWHRYTSYVIIQRNAWHRNASEMTNRHGRICMQAQVRAHFTVLPFN